MQAAQHHNRITRNARVASGDGTGEVPARHEKERNLVLNTSPGKLFTLTVHPDFASGVWRRHWLSSCSSREGAQSVRSISGANVRCVGTSSLGPWRTITPFRNSPLFFEGVCYNSSIPSIQKLLNFTPNFGVVSYLTSR